MRTFISYSRTDKIKANEIADLLRLHYVSFFLDERGAGIGELDQVILGELDQAKKFMVLLSPAALKSKWVRKEIARAIDSEKFKGDAFLPILIEPIEPSEDWMDLHPKIRDWLLIDFVSDRERAEQKLIEGVYNRPRHRHSYYQVGDVKIQVLILAGGDGKTRYRDGEIVCYGPTHDRQNRKYQLPSDIAEDAERRLADVAADCQKRGAMFVNNPQVRLVNYGFGSGSESGGLNPKPLRLTMGWTEYYHTRLTNQTREFVLPCGRSIAIKYGAALEEFEASGLSNPIAVNM